MTCFSCARCSSSAPSPRGGSRTPRPSSNGSTRSTTAGSSSVGSPSGRSAPPSSRWPAATSRPGCAATGSARRPWRGCGCRGSSRPASSRGACSAKSIALGAHAYHAATDADDAYARSLFATSRERILRMLDAANPQLDFPVAGLALFALGAWGLLRDAAPVEDAVELLVLAERFAYNRMIPTMAWERIAPHAEARAPGRIAALRDGARRPAAAGAARPGARPGRAASAARGDACSCARPAGRRSPSR